jgi:hypothetical protein
MRYELAPVDTICLLDWDSAVMYCRFLSANNKQDWRLPTIAELLLVDLPNDTVIWTEMCVGDGRMLFGYDETRGRLWWSVDKDSRSNVWAIRTK